MNFRSVFFKRLIVVYLICTIVLGKANAVFALSKDLRTNGYGYNDLDLYYNTSTQTLENDDNIRFECEITMREEDYNVVEIDKVVAVFENVPENQNDETIDTIHLDMKGSQGEDNKKERYSFNIMNSYSKEVKNVSFVRKSFEEIYDEYLENDSYEKVDIKTFKSGKMIIATAKDDSNESDGSISRKIDTDLVLCYEKLDLPIDGKIKNDEIENNNGILCIKVNARISLLTLNASVEDSSLERYMELVNKSFEVKFQEEKVKLDEYINSWKKVSVTLEKNVDFIIAKSSGNKKIGIVGFLKDFFEVVFALLLNLFLVIIAIMIYNVYVQSINDKFKTRRFNLYVVKQLVKSDTDAFYELKFKVKEIEHGLPKENDELTKALSFESDSDLEIINELIDGFKVVKVGLNESKVGAKTINVLIKCSSKQFEFENIISLLNLYNTDVQISKNPLFVLDTEEKDYEVKVLFKENARNVLRLGTDTDFFINKNDVITKRGNGKNEFLLTYRHKYVRKLKKLLYRFRNIDLYVDDVENDVDEINIDRLKVVLCNPTLVLELLDDTFIIGSSSILKLKLAIWDKVREELIFVCPQDLSISCDEDDVTFKANYVETDFDDIYYRLTLQKASENISKTVIINVKVNYENQDYEQSLVVKIKK